MNRNLSIIILSILMLPELQAQGKLGFEHYHVWQKSRPLLMPTLHYTSPRGWYGELRYNYESEGAAGFHVGRVFRGGRKLRVEFTPCLGYITGSLEAASASINTELLYGKWNFSFNWQYGRGLKGDGSFLFNWSELSTGVGQYGFAGLAFQLNMDQHGDESSPGLMTGFANEWITVPLYLFRSGNKQHFVLGIYVELRTGKPDK